MTCEHAETTTLLWLYGEADEAHAAHVAGCAECTAVADLHVDVMARVLPVAPAIAAEASTPASGRRRWPAWVAGGLALAAAALLVARLVTPTPITQSDTAVAALTPTPALEPAVSVLLDDAFDAELDALDDDLDALALDLYDL